MALGTRTKYQLELLIRSTISEIYKFWENILGSLQNISETLPRYLHAMCSGKNPIVIHDGSSTDGPTAVEQLDIPRQRVRVCLPSANDTGTGCQATLHWNTNSSSLLFWQPPTCTTGYAFSERLSSRVIGFCLDVCASFYHSLFLYYGKQ